MEGTKTFLGAKHGKHQKQVDFVRIIGEGDCTDIRKSSEPLVFRQMTARVRLRLKNRREMIPCVLKMSDPIECPVCNGKFSASVINDHVEACLDKEDCCSAKSVDKTVSAVKREVDLEKEDQKVLEVIPPPSSKSASGCCEVGTLAGNDTLCQSLHVNENMKAVSKLKPTKAKDEKCKPINAHQSIFDILGKRKYSALSKQPMNDVDRKRTKFPGNNIEAKREKHFSLQNGNDHGKALVKTNDFDEREVKGFSPSTKTNSKAIDLEKPVPLAEQMRPISFDDYVGQDDLIGENSTLRALLSSEKVPSFILWGPPGCGKVFIHANAFITFIAIVS